MSAQIIDFPSLRPTTPASPRPYTRNAYREALYTAIVEAKHYDIQPDPILRALVQWMCQSNLLTPPPKLSHFCGQALCRIVDGVSDHLDIEARRLFAADTLDALREEAFRLHRLRLP